MKKKLFSASGSIGSESLILYHKLNQKIEKVSKQMDLVLVKVSVFIPFASAFVMSMANYYIFDMKEDSFYLPCPIWYDHLMLDDKSNKC